MRDSIPFIWPAQPIHYSLGGQPVCGRVENDLMFHACSVESAVVTCAACRAWLEAYGESSEDPEEAYEEGCYS